MDFITFTDRIEAYAAFINNLKQYENTLLKPTTIENSAKIAAADLYTNTYAPWAVDCKAITFKLKDAYVERHDDVLHFIDEMLGSGYQDTHALTLQALKTSGANLLLCNEAESLYKINYVVDYFRRMVDVSHPLSWLNDIDLFKNINDVSYSRLKTETVQLFSNLTI